MKQGLKKLGTVLTMLVLVIGCTYAVIKDNIHTVIPGKIYRSAQLDEDTLAALIVSKKIKSVINLRGSHPRRDWYQQEMRAVNKMKIEHYDVKLSAHKLPSTERLIRLTNLILNAPKPLLIHCKSGADRTGLAAAMAIILSDAPALDEAEDQISVLYGAIATDTVGRLVMPKYVTWLEQSKTPHSKSAFTNWVNHFYVVS